MAARRTFNKQKVVCTNVKCCVQLAILAFALTLYSCICDAWYGIWSCTTGNSGWRRCAAKKKKITTSTFVETDTIWIALTLWLCSCLFNIFGRILIGLITFRWHRTQLYVVYMFQTVNCMFSSSSTTTLMLFFFCFFVYKFNTANDGWFEQIPMKQTCFALVCFFKHISHRKCVMRNIFIHQFYRIDVYSKFVIHLKLSVRVDFFYANQNYSIYSL